MPQMKCHYEVLGVPRDASGDDLKKSYRKLALKWHPDKNLDNVEESSQQFRLVQQAYEVLSDPQERAWYDKHREAILMGGMGRGDDYQDDSLNVFQYFNSSCYKGFGDDKEGFYAVYDEVFKTLAEEDRQFMEEEDFVVYDFGNTSSVYEEVVKPFYDHWESYCTAKSYVWVEKYDTREAPDRRVRRLMEAENKKLRDVARKARNEEVRALVKYVKKRDKRVQEYKKRLEERAEEINRKAKEQRQRHLEESRKKLENYKETEWSSSSTLENHYQELEAKYARQFGDHADEGSDNSGQEEAEEEDYDDLFCVACNKMFKSDKAFMNHQKSKKHREMIAIIRAHMEEEEAEHRQAGGGTEDGEGGATHANEGEAGLGFGLEEEPEEMDNTPQKLSKKQKKKRRQQKNMAQEEEVDGLAENLKSSSLQEPDVTPVKSQSKRDKRRARKNRQLSDSEDEEEDQAAQEPLPSSMDNNRSDHIPESANTNTTSPADKDNIEARVGENCDDRLSDPSEDKINGVGEADIQGEAVDGVSITLESQAETKPSKKKQAKAAPDPNQKPGSCGICGEEFPSRSKLFDHIKASGHAMVKNAPPSDTHSQKQGKKNKKKKAK